jgi:hypothetical protein
MGPSRHVGASSWVRMLRPRPSSRVSGRAYLLVRVHLLHGVRGDSVEGVLPELRRGTRAAPASSREQAREEPGVHSARSQPERLPIDALDVPALKMIRDDANVVTLRGCAGAPCTGVAGHVRYVERREKTQLDAISPPFGSSRGDVRRADPDSEVSRLVDAASGRAPRHLREAIPSHHGHDEVPSPRRATSVARLTGLVVLIGSSWKCRRSSG